MAKRVFAVTNIKGSGVWVNAGDEVDLSKFSQEDLKQLYDAGALEIREETETAKESTEKSENSENNPWFTKKTEDVHGPDTTVEDDKSKAAPVKKTGGKA